MARKYAEEKKGNVVRYGGGSTAMAELRDPHAGGWHAKQCMGGITFISGPFYELDEEDRATWDRIQAENEARWGKRYHSLDFAHLRRENVKRCEAAYFPLESKDGPWWGNAMAGECGEACNFVKKIDRDGETPELVQALAYELADLVTYADLLAARYGIDLGRAVVDKFNIVSDRTSCSIKLK
jgi:NTP pyrophosphatase (non-canonical NTP hydrolase)